MPEPGDEFYHKKREKDTESKRNGHYVNKLKTLEEAVQKTVDAIAMQIMASKAKNDPKYRPTEEEEEKIKKEVRPLANVIINKPEIRKTYEEGKINKALEDARFELDLREVREITSRKARKKLEEQIMKAARQGAALQKKVEERTAELYGGLRPASDGITLRKSRKMKRK